MRPRKNTTKKETKRLKERLARLEKHGEEAGETLPRVLRDYLPNHKGFQDEEVFAAIVRVCVGPCGIAHEDLAAAWGCVSPEAISLFAMGKELPPRLLLPPLIQILQVRFGQLTASPVKSAA